MALARSGRGRGSSSPRRADLPLPRASDRIEGVRSLRPLLVAAVLAVWVAPGAASAAIAVHLLIEDHHAAAHLGAGGTHEHEVFASAGHDHEMIESARSTVPRPPMAEVAAPAVSGSVVAERARTLPVQIISTAAPPGALFLSHCALLI